MLGLRAPAPRPGDEPWVHLRATDAQGQRRHVLGGEKWKVLELGGLERTGTGCRRSAAGFAARRPAREQVKPEARAGPATSQAACGTENLINAVYRLRRRLTSSLSCSPPDARDDKPREGGRLEALCEASLGSAGPWRSGPSVGSWGPHPCWVGPGRWPASSRPGTSPALPGSSFRASQTHPDWTEVTTARWERELAWCAHWPVVCCPSWSR